MFSKRVSPSVSPMESLVKLLLKLLACALLAPAALVACAAPELQPTDVGQVAIFEDLSRREVYEATAKVMAAQNLQILEQDLAQGSIRAEVRSGLPTWGEVVAAYVTDLPDGGVQLKVVSKKRAQWQIGEHDWANAVVNAVRIELDAFE